MHILLLVINIRISELKHQELLACSNISLGNVGCHVLVVQVATTTSLSVIHPRILYTVAASHHQKSK